MAVLTKITGVREIIRNMRKAKKRKKLGLEKGLVLAGLFLQRESQMIVPVDTGTLRASAFTRKQGTGLRTEVHVGYTTSYAIFVHEDLQAKHAAGKTAKFLEKPAREKQPQMRVIIRGAIDRA